MVFTWVPFTHIVPRYVIRAQITRPTWSPPGADRTQVGPIRIQKDIQRTPLFHDLTPTTTTCYYCLLEKHLKRDGTPSCQTSRYPATASASFSRTSSPTKPPVPTKFAHWYCGNSERRSRPSWKPYSQNLSTPENYHTTGGPPAWSPYTRKYRNIYQSTTGQSPWPAYAPS